MPGLRLLYICAALSWGNYLHAGEVIPFTPRSPEASLPVAPAPRFYPACTLTLSPETNWQWPSTLMLVAKSNDTEVLRARFRLSATLEPSAAQILNHLMKLVHPQAEPDAQLFVAPASLTKAQIAQRARERNDDLRLTLHALDGVLNTKQKLLYGELLRLIFRVI